MDLNELRTEIAGCRGDLLRIASLQLRDRHAAEDAVQETLLAGLMGAESYDGRARVKTWLVGILRFKVIDVLRAKSKAPRNASDLAAELSTEDIEALFDETGVWRDKPLEWNDPSRAVHEQEFDRILEECLRGLPNLSAQVFALREIFGVEPSEICEILTVTRNHLNVLLHRARLSLRGCMDVNWVREGGIAS